MAVFHIVGLLVWLQCCYAVVQEHYLFDYVPGVEPRDMSNDFDLNPDYKKGYGWMTANDKCPLKGSPTGHCVEFMVKNCKVGCYRSEVNRKESIPYDVEQWYGFAFALPEDYSNGNEVDSIHFQIHGKPDKNIGEDYRNPMFALRAEPYDRWRVAYRGDKNKKTVKKNGKFVYSAEEYTDIGPIRPGVWEHWVVRIFWSYKGKGSIKVWRNKKEVFAVYNTWTTFNDDLGPYYQVGIYKPNWRNYTPKNTFKGNVYYGELKMSYNTDFDEISTTPQSCHYTAYWKNALIDAVNKMRLEELLVPDGTDQLRVAPANPLPEWKWNSGLAASAQRWADKCQATRIQPFMERLYVDNYKFLNQLVHVGKDSEYTLCGNPEGAWQLVQMWYDQRKYWVKSKAECERGNNCLGWSQLMWSTTKYFGCAYSSCSGDNLWVCNFAEGGNLRGQNPYAPPYGT